MDEKLYKKVKGIGASNLAFGIITLVFGKIGRASCRERV